MDTQSIIALLIAIAAALWAANKILRPIVNEFRKKKSDKIETGCGSCGDEKGSLCGKPKNHSHIDD